MLKISIRLQYKTGGSLGKLPHNADINRDWQIIRENITSAEDQCPDYYDLNQLLRWCDEKSLPTVLSMEGR
jgi:hypothetical protein